MPVENGIRKARVKTPILNPFIFKVDKNHPIRSVKNISEGKLN
jgi:hypothetical protein